MKIVLFAGGVGTRLWPLSRRNTPKQFEKIIGNKSMLQIAVGKLMPEFTWEDIYISTSEQYDDIVLKQLPEIPKDNVILEPAMRDVGPAVGLITSIFVKQSPDEPIALLWGSDHLVRKEELFRKSLRAAEQVVKENPERIVFIGQKPRFANQNLGYLEFGDQVKVVNEIPVHGFKSLQYRPHLSTAERYLKDGKHSWNLGYFVTTPRFLWKLFKEFAPEMFLQLEKINAVVDTAAFPTVLHEIYPQIEKISFDNAILEKMDPKDGYVISVDVGWSDIGAWEALKEALSSTEEENVTKGKVMLEDSKDCLVFNYHNQMTVCIDLEEMLVINTSDVLLICPKTSVPKIKKLVESLSGTENEHLA